MPEKTILKLQQLLFLAKMEIKVLKQIILENIPWALSDNAKKEFQRQLKMKD